MKVRSEAAQTGMDTRHATGGFRRRTRQYVENPTERNAVDMPGFAAAVEAS